jgi:hypothetical protein
MSAQLAGLRPGAVPAWAKLAGIGAVSSRAARATDDQAAGRREAAARAAVAVAVAEGRGNRARVKGNRPHHHSLQPAGSRSQGRRSEASVSGYRGSRTRRSVQSKT